MEKSELQKRLTLNHQAFAQFIGSLTDPVANNSMPGKWTPVQQLDHIVKSVGPVRVAFTLPKFVLATMFGKSNRPSYSYDELVARYKARLAEGAKSTARYLPDPSCSRSGLIKVVEQRVARLCEKIERFTETELDQYLLPHPLMGKLTLREMLYFTIYHVEHHHIQINPRAVAA